jgi:hypothetical protein
MVLQKKVPHVLQDEKGCTAVSIDGPGPRNARIRCIMCSPSTVAKLGLPTKSAWRQHALKLTLGNCARWHNGRQLHLIQRTVLRLRIAGRFGLRLRSAFETPASRQKRRSKSADTSGRAVCVCVCVCVCVTGELKGQPAHPVEGTPRPTARHQNQPPKRDGVGPKGKRRGMHPPSSHLGPTKKEWYGGGAQEGRDGGFPLSLPLILTPQVHRHLLHRCCSGNTNYNSDSTCPTCFTYGGGTHTVTHTTPQNIKTMQV